MRILSIALVALSTNLLCSDVIAQQHSYSGVTAENIAEEQEACSADAIRFCAGNQMAIFEMESCLSRHTQQLSPACRDEIAPTDFRKYHDIEQNMFD